MALDLDANERFCAYFSRTEEARDASPMIPREKIPFSWAETPAVEIILSPRVVVASPPPRLEDCATRGATLFWLSKGVGPSGLRHPRRKPFISRCIVTCAATSME